MRRTTCASNARGREVHTHVAHPRTIGHAEPAAAALCIIGRRVRLRFPVSRRKHARVRNAAAAFNVGVEGYGLKQVRL